LYHFLIQRKIISLNFTLGGKIDELEFGFIRYPLLFQVRTLTSNQVIQAKMNFQVYSLASHADWACVQVKTPDSEARTPVHLCCVIDTSASMETDYKLANVKQSLQFLLDFLVPQDKISVITFSETARTILNQVAVTAAERDNIRARLSIIRVESNTNLSAGIVQSRESLEVDTSNIKQGILLLTDGHANMGLTLPADIIELVRNTISKFAGTSISCVGYGTDHNVELLQNISTEGGGSYYVVNNLEDVAMVFGDVLGGLVSCSAQQVRAILPAGTEVKSRYASNTTDAGVEIVIGDMSAGMEAAFLAKIPVGATVGLKGFNLQTHNTFEMTSVVAMTDDAALQVDGQAHYLRFEVLALLEQARPLMNWSTATAMVAEHITKITTLITTITDYQRDHAHSLWPILLEELNNCKHSLENRGHNNHESAGLMTQHAGYLGRMRGLAAAPSQGPHVHWGGVSAVASDPGATPSGEVPGPIPLGRTFSNTAQRQISSQLAATSSATPLARQQASGRSTQDPSASPPMIPRAAPSLVPSMSCGLAPTASTGISRLMTLGVAVPPDWPSTGLTRQNACGITENSENSEDDDE